jgi:hypothetical protein
MGTPIEDATIGKNTHFAPDVILDDVALESSGATTSAEFLLAQTLGKTEVRIVATTAIATAGDSLTVTIVTADVSGGTFNNTIFTEVITGKSFAIGDTLSAYIPTQEVAECYTKVIITSDYVATDESVSAFTIEV